MGLLDTVIGALGQGSAGGIQAALLQAVVAMLAQGGPSGQGVAGGGLADIVARLQQGRLGDVVGSWVGTGRNLPVSPEQLGGDLGDDVLAGLAQRSGIDAGELLGPLSQLLPQVVDQFTPGGELPRGGKDVGAAPGQLLGR